MRKETKQKLLLLAGSLTIALIGVEAVSRYLVNNHFRTAHIFEASPYTSFTLVPGIVDRHASREYAIDYEVNKQGFRGPMVPIPKARGDKHILVLGDSFVFGHGVEVEQGLCQQLAERFHQNGAPNVRVINGGFMAGTAPDDAYAFMMSERGRAFEPDMIILVPFLKNDFRDLAGHIWEKTDARGLPSHIRAETDFPNAVHARGTIPFYKQNAILKHLAMVQLFMRFYFGTFELPERNRRIQALEDAGIAQKEGLPDRFRRVIIGFDEEAKRRGIPFIVATIPTGDQVHGEPDPYYDLKKAALDRLLDERHVPHLTFDKTTGHTGDLRYPLDGHWTAAGHQKAAAALYELVQPLWSEPAPSESEILQ